MYMIFCNGFEPWIQDFYSRSKIRPFFNYHSSTCICAWTNSHFWTASSGTIVSVYSDFLGVSLYPIHLTSKLLSKQIIKDLDVHLPTMISLNSSEAFTMYLCVMIQTGTVYTCWNIILYNVCPFNRWLSYNTGHFIPWPSYVEQCSWTSTPGRGACRRMEYGSGRSAINIASTLIKTTRHQFNNVAQLILSVLIPIMPVNEIQFWLQKQSLRTFSF